MGQATAEIKKALSIVTKANGDSIFHFSPTIYLERKKGSVRVAFHRDGKELMLDKATIDDLKFLLLEDFILSNIEGYIFKNKTFQYKQGNQMLASQTKSVVLSITDNYLTNYCENCHIRAKSGSLVTKDTVCSVVCPVGVELQLLGSLYELHTKIGKARSKKSKISTADITVLRETIAERQLRTIKTLYEKLVRPEPLSSKDIQEKRKLREQKKKIDECKGVRQ